MRLLVDTHAALWLLGDDDRLSVRAEELLTDTTNEVLLSAAVVWEVSIMRSLGKLEVPDGFADQLLDGGATALPVDVEHAQVVGSLPWHHRDPFDRMLVAQASVEGAKLLSHDPILRSYGVEVVW